MLSFGKSTLLWIVGGGLVIGGIVLVATGVGHTGPAPSLSGNGTTHTPTPTPTLSALPTTTPPSTTISNENTGSGDSGNNTGTGDSSQNNTGPENEVQLAHLVITPVYPGGTGEKDWLESLTLQVNGADMDPVEITYPPPIPGSLTVDIPSGLARTVTLRGNAKTPVLDPRPAYLPHEPRNYVTGISGSLDLAKDQTADIPVTMTDHIYMYAVATLDGADIPGPVPCDYLVAGTTALTGNTLPAVFSDVSAGEYVVHYVSGGPDNAVFTSITPSPNQTVSLDRISVFILDFVSSGSITVTGSRYTSNWNGPCNYEITGNTPNGPVTLTGTEVPFTFTGLPVGTYNINYLSGGPEGYEYYGIYPSDNLEISAAENKGAFQIRFIMLPVVVAVPPATADLSITAAGLYTGAAGTYTITVTNSGPVAATGVIVTLTLPPDEDGPGTLFPVSYASDVPSQGVYAAGVWTIGTINNGSTVTLTVNVTIAGGVTLFNNFTATAEVTTSPVPDPDSIPGNNNPAEDDQASATFTS
jgi:hypothetical protein